MELVTLDPAAGLLWCVYHGKYETPGLKPEYVGTFMHGAASERNGLEAL